MLKILESKTARIDLELIRAGAIARSAGFAGLTTRLLPRGGLKLFPNLGKWPQLRKLRRKIPHQIPHWSQTQRAARRTTMTPTRTPWPAAENRDVLQ